MTIGLNRRAFMGDFGGLGLGGTLFPGVLWARAQEVVGAPCAEEPTLRVARAYPDATDFHARVPPEFAV